MGPLLEASKKQFAGSELQGKTLGVLGLGAIGSLIARLGLDLGMEVVGYDPAISIEAAWRLPSSVKRWIICRRCSHVLTTYRCTSQSWIAPEALLTPTR